MKLKEKKRLLDNKVWWKYFSIIKEIKNCEFVHNLQQKLIAPMIKVNSALKIMFLAIILFQDMIITKSIPMINLN